MKSSYPLGHILNPATPYVAAIDTDISKRFAAIAKAREKREQEASADTQKIIDIYNARREQKA